MRIITGSARGTRLMTLEGDDTRPTAERAKEAIFSMIQFDIDGRKVLDLFSGSGQLALEALSRGASEAVCIDSNPAAVKIIKANAEKTHMTDRCTVLNSDWKAYVKTHGGEKYGIIFIDPPYEAALCADAVKRLNESDMIADHAMIVCESGSDEYIVGEGLKILRHVKYGRAYVTLLTKESEGI